MKTIKNCNHKFSIKQSFQENLSNGIGDRWEIIIILICEKCGKKKVSRTEF